MDLHKKMKLVIIIIILFIIFFAVVGLKEKNKIIFNQTNTNGPINNKKPIWMCYYRSTPTDRGFFDVSWLKLNIFENKVSGEFHNLPAESDSKIGTFEGAVGPLDQSIMGRRALVWWDSFAEGMNTKEELMIVFGDGSATVGFGEMIDRGDGVYVYKNKNNLYYIEQMGQMDCEFLEEKLFVEKYVRDNITNMATNKAVLGGTWYVIKVIVTPTNHTGEVTYEDGHIQSEAEFIYTYQKDPQSITITKFEVKE